MEACASLSQSNMLISKRERSIGIATSVHAFVVTAETHPALVESQAQNSVRHALETFLPTWICFDTDARCQSTCRSYRAGHNLHDEVTPASIASDQVASLASIGCRQKTNPEGPSGKRHVFDAAALDKRPSSPFSVCIANLTAGYH
jgi:hypothetical protein